MEDTEKLKEQMEVIKDKKDAAEKSDTYKGNIYTKIKNNISLCTVSFSGIWFFLTLFVELIIRVYNSGYYDSLKLDKTYFYYNDEDITICMFYAAIFLIVAMVIIFIYLEWKIKGKIFLCILGTTSLYYVITQKVLLKKDISVFVMWALAQELNFLIVFLLGLSIIGLLIKKLYGESLNINFVMVFGLVFTILFNISLLHYIYDYAGRIILNYPTFEIAYVENDNPQNIEYYIVLWKNEDKLCMRKIDYDKNIKELTIPEKSQIIIGEGLSNFTYFSKTFESVKIESPIEPDAMINTEITMETAQWQFEFVTLDDGIEYVSERLPGSNPLYLHQYEMESIGTQKYIVVDMDEWIMVSRENIKQSRCVNSLYKEYENKKIWELIDYRNFEKLKKESEENEKNSLENSQ